MKFIIALWLGKLINLLVSIIDKSRGSNLAGQWAMKIDRKMVYHFWKKGIDCSKVLFVTGTNGKSTTNNLINHIFKVNGKKVVSNLEGANLIFGIATALIKASTLTGKINTDFFIFETDERFMPIIRAQLPAENVMITNLEKDQVQRNGDPDFIYRKLYQAFGGHQNPAGASGGYQTQPARFSASIKTLPAHLLSASIKTLPAHPVRFPAAVKARLIHLRRTVLLLSSCRAAGLQIMLRLRLSQLKLLRSLQQWMLKSIFLSGRCTSITRSRAPGLSEVLLGVSLLTVSRSTASHS